MYIRKTLARLLITAMIAGSICFPVPAEEINIPAAEQSVVTEQTESGSESGLSDTVVIESESESDTEPETEAPAETEAETVAETEAETEIPAETVFETEDKSIPETAGTEETVTEKETEGENTAAVQAEAETELTAVPETEAPAETETETAEDTVSSDETVLLAAVTPRAATGFKVVPADTHISLSWKKGTDAKGYRIEMQDVSANRTSWIAATEKTSYRVTGLKPNQTYKFRLLAWTGASPNFTFGEYNNWVTVKTRLFTPDTPTGLTASVSGTTAKVAWKASTYAQKYRICVYDNQKKKAFWGAFTASTSATITGLDKAHTYRFRVQAYRSAAGIYTYSGYTSWVSPSAPAVTPETPSGLTVRSEDRSVALSWNAAKYAHRYRVKIYDCESKKSSWAAFTSNTSATITGLENNHTYKFCVQAYRNNSGTYTYSAYTPWSSITVTPLADAQAIGWNNSVIICWPKVAGATLYRIYSVNTSTGKKTWVRSFSSATEYRINGLNNGTTYAYRVYAYEGNTVYAYSPVLTATAAEPRSKYVSTALTYLGAKEGSALHKEIIDIYNTQKPVPAGYKMTYTDPWCAAFATAMAVKANVIRMIPGECSCTRQIALWKQLGYYVAGRSYTPSVGDLVYYSWTKNASSPDHVGIVTKVTSTTLTVIEGNKSNAVSERVINDYKHYGYIIGYGKPNGN